MNGPIQKSNDTDSPAGETPVSDIPSVEINLFVAHWAEIQKEMNRLLAQEDD